MSDKKQKGQDSKVDKARDADEISDEALESVAGGCQHGCSVPNSDDRLQFPDFLKIPDIDPPNGVGIS